MNQKGRLHALDPLLKPKEIKDHLHRETEFVDRFFHLIKDSIEPPYAISIDGLWGTGKTTIMRLLYDKFNDEDYPVFWFNPWEYHPVVNCDHFPILMSVPK